MMVINQGQQQVQQLVSVNGQLYLQNVNQNNRGGFIGNGVNAPIGGGKNNPSTNNKLMPFIPNLTNSQKVQFTPNAYTSNQLSNINANVQQNPFYDAYQAKISNYGLFPGINAPTKVSK